MSQPFLGEIRMFGFNFAPRGWQLCNGQTLPISQYSALFALLGTTYGGNGTSTFQLPNLQGQVPIHQGTGGGGTYVQGEASGAPSVTLLSNNMPTHSHLVNAVTGAAGAANTPAGNYPAQATINPTTTHVETYSSATQNATMNPNMVATAGGNVPHNNMQPYLVVNFCIAMEGIFPSRN
jgi:microcystin-dependent protein